MSNTHEPSLWLDRIRLAAELTVVFGGAVIAVIAAAEELREIRSVRGELTEFNLTGRREEQGDGSR